MPGKKFSDSIDWRRELRFCGTCLVVACIIITITIVFGLLSVGEDVVQHGDEDRDEELLVVGFILIPLVLFGITVVLGVARVRSWERRRESQLRGALRAGLRTSRRRKH